MKRFFLVVMTVILMAFNVQAESITLSWDPNDPTPEGYRAFSRRDSQAYDYSRPDWEGQATTCTIDYPNPALPDIPPADNLSGSWDKRSSKINLAWHQSESVNTHSYKWILRAYEGILESIDSEEVGHDFVMTNTVNRWEIFYSMVKGGPYTEFSGLDATMGTSITKPFMLIPAGESKPVFFVLVTFGKNETFSENSPEIEVLIDRRLPDSPKNIKKTVVIPVE